MTVYIVLIGSRVNSVWSTRQAANAHVVELIKVNGYQIAVRIEDIEVRS